MKVSFLPKSKRGKWSFIFFFTEVVMMTIFFSIIAIFDTKGGDTFFSNPELSVPFILAWASGSMAFVLGCVTLIKDKPKSVLVFVITSITLLTTLFGIFEVTSPH